MIDLTGSRILITGGAGFVGSHIADQLARENVAEIVLLDNLVRGSKDNIRDVLDAKKAMLIEGDIRNRDLLDRVCEGIDYCFHMAALRITHCVAEPRQALEVMFDGTFNVAEACVKHKIKKVVLASSASIYGGADRFPTREDHHPYNNRTLYGAAKTANELMFRSFHDMHGMHYVAMRYFNIYGPRMDTHGKYTEVLIRWYRLIKEGTPPVIFGDGKQTMDFIYVEEVARANILGLKSNAVDEVFNVASGEETSLGELCRTLLEVMNSKLEPRYVPLPAERKMVEVTRRLADVAKAKKKLGFKSGVPLKEGLKKLVEWLEEVQAWRPDSLPAGN